MTLQLSSLPFSVSYNELEFNDPLRKIQACKYCCSKKLTALHKSGVISEGLKIWFHPPKNEPNHCPLTFQHKVKGKRQWFGPFFGDGVKLKIHSDIIPPLYVAGCHKDSINQKYEGRHTRGGLISERFSLCLQSQKKGAKTREHYPPKENMLSIVIRHLFLEIWAKVKSFLRLSHFYQSK